MTEPEAESDTHASFESGFRNNSIVQNNNYSSCHNYQNTPPFLAPLYTLWGFFFCFLKKHHCIHRAPGESREGVCPPDPLSRLPPTYPPLPRVQMSFTLLSHCGPIMWFEPYEGNKYFPGLHVCSTIFDSKLACGIEKGGGQDAGVDGTQNVSTGLSLLIPLSLFCFVFSFLFIQGSKRAQLQTQTSGSGPQSQSS